MGRKPKPDKGKPHTIHLHPDDVANLDRLRASLGCSRSEAVARLIRYGWRALLERHERKEAGNAD